jgi:repressor LexA
MEDAGIYEGDMVIVERGKKPKNGDIVIAEIDGEYTMKFYRTGGAGGGTYLEPANKKYPILYPNTELVIIAVVKVVIRKF